MHEFCFHLHHTHCALLALVELPHCHLDVHRRAADDGGYYHRYSHVCDFQECHYVRGRAKYRCESWNGYVCVHVDRSRVQHRWFYYPLVSQLLLCE